MRAVALAVECCPTVVQVALIHTSLKVQSSIFDSWLFTIRLDADQTCVVQVYSRRTIDVVSGSLDGATVLVELQGASRDT